MKFHYEKYHQTRVKHTNIGPNATLLKKIVVVEASFCEFMSTSLL